MSKRGGDRLERWYDAGVVHELIVPPGVREPSDGEALFLDEVDRRCAGCDYRGDYCPKHGSTAP